MPPSKRIRSGSSSHDKLKNSTYASATKSPSLVREFIEYIALTRKWWLLPLLIAIGLVSAILAAPGSTVLPFIYALF